MRDHPNRPPILDMTPEGGFRGPAPASWLDRALLRVGGAAVLVALVAGGLTVAALAFVVVGLLLPVALVAGLVAFGALWWRVRQARRRGGARTVFATVRR